jgi:peptidoglycan hydrolase CwlO-like protein
MDNEICCESKCVSEVEYIKELKATIEDQQAEIDRLREDLREHRRKFEYLLRSTWITPPIEADIKHFLGKPCPAEVKDATEL